MNITKISAGILISTLFLTACANVDNDGQNGTTLPNGTTIQTPDVNEGENGTTTPPAGNNDNQDQSSVVNQIIPTNKDNVTLSDQQKSQLKAGEEAHSTKTLTFDVTGGAFYFVPNIIKVKKGDTVKINLKNSGGLHNLYIDEFNVKSSNINTGESTMVEFVADKTGSFEFYCQIVNHRQMGMKGTLIVE